MTPAFTVIAPAHFEREFRRLRRRHAELSDLFARALAILETDPYNRSRTHPIKKLENVPTGEAQYRIRLGRFRFRYDIEGQIVYLKRCSLRREDTYR
jgi:mRNA-degrading endonuclease RelE of RelBE toxin-antitoxin system